MAEKKLNFDNPLLKDYGEPTAEEPMRRKRGRPRKDGMNRNPDGGNSTREGLPIGSTRFSVISKDENIKNLKDYAYTKRITIKDAFNEIIEDFFKRYKKNPKNEQLLDHTGGNKWT